jgi:hypothetical protein
VPFESPAYAFKLTEPSAIDIAEHLRAHKKGSADVLKEVGNKLLSSKNGGVVARGKRLLDEIK